MSRMVGIVALARSVKPWLGNFVSQQWYGLQRIILTPLCRVLFRLRVEGREHEPRHGPFIAAFNHASAVDPLLAALSLQRRCRFMAKPEVLKIPILGPYLASVGTFAIRRGEPDRKAFRLCLQILMGGGVLVMWPEGTRSPDGRLQSAEPGAARIALRTGVPILPVAMVGSHHVLPKGGRWPKFAPVTVRFGPLIQVPRIKGPLSDKVLEAWGHRIMVEIGKLLPPSQGGTREEEAQPRPVVG